MFVLSKGLEETFLSQFWSTLHCLMSIALQSFRFNFGYSAALLSCSGCLYHVDEVSHCQLSWLVMSLLQFRVAVIESSELSLDQSSTCRFDDLDHFGVRSGHLSQIPVRIRLRYFTIILINDAYIIRKLHRFFWPCNPNCCQPISSFYCLSLKCIGK